MSDSGVPRMTPLPPSDWNAAVLEALAGFPAGLKFVMSELAAKPDTAPRGQHLLGALALHPALARPFLIFSEYIATASSLSARDRELIILRISWLHRSEYEFMQHLILARGAGIGETQLREIEQGPDAPGWSADDAAVLRAVDELHAQARVSDATWVQLRERFETPQLMDLLFLAGGYTTLAFVLNSIGLPLEASAEPADPDVRRRLHAARN